MMKYERMRYGYDRRAWVKMVDEKLPEMEDHAARLQNEAQMQWDNLQKWPENYRRVGMVELLVSECYETARYKLWQCIYYKGMREANRDGD